MRSVVLVRTLGVCLGILMATVGLAGAAALPKHPPTPKPRPNVVIANTERLCLARVIYTEARNQIYHGQVMVGYTVKRRKELNRPDLGGNTYCGVAHARLDDGTKQYSGINRSDAFAADDKKAWATALRAADHVLGGFRPYYPWSEVTYYLAPESSDPANRCWFAKGLMEVGWLGGHRFYREPTQLDKLVLKISDLPPECEKKLVRG